MLFNSFKFLCFFLIFYSFYLLTRRSLKWQNRVLLAASYLFYAAWDWRFLFLLVATTFLDFLLAAWIFRSRDPIRKKTLLIASIISNLGVLGFFKYYNFFAENTGLPALHVVLPIAISFYTFQSMSYTIDVYRGELVPPKSFWDFAVFVSYFPHLVAGPILRATSILPQVLNPRKITREQFYQGCYLIFWGLFQKIFVADNLAKVADPLFNGRGPYEGWQVLVAVYAFAFQILCDFSGYSDIARGLGKLMGFDIVINFNLPYFATNPRDFWKRWHISLSTWLRDYLYIPLGGSRGGRLLEYRNLFLTMLLGGLWHGAAWTFVAWGIYHGMLLVIHRSLEPFFATIPGPKNFWDKNLRHFFKTIFFFHLVCIGWIFFRAGSLTQALMMIRSLFQLFHFSIPPDFQGMLLRFVFFAGILLLVQSFQYAKRDLMAVLRAPVFLRSLFYLVTFYLLLGYGTDGAKTFIYFQF